jgi:hypothetical protein
VKPHYRLHVNLGDRKPLWWVTWTHLVGSMSMRCTTGGYTDPSTAILDARIRSR